LSSIGNAVAFYHACLSVVASNIECCGTHSGAFSKLASVL